MSAVVDKVLGRGFFEVDEAFVKEHLKGLKDDDRELMNAFVAQSQEVSLDDMGELRARRALFRIGSVPSKPCDDSPLQDVHNPTPPRMGEFDYNGQLVATDGTRETKLTKLFKRRDNKGRLLDAIHKMKLDR